MGSRNSKAKSNQRQLLDEFYLAQRAKKYEQCINRLIRYHSLNLTRCNLTHFPEELLEYIEHNLIISQQQQQQQQNGDGDGDDIDGDGDGGEQNAENDNSSNENGDKNNIKTKKNKNKKKSKKKKKKKGHAHDLVLSSSGGSPRARNSITGLPSPLMIPTDDQVKNFMIREVALGSNQLKEWPFATFNKLHGYGVLCVDEIHAAFSCLETVDAPSVFRWDQIFPKLEKLFLFANYIERMPDSLGACANLVTLDLRSNPCIDQESFVPFLTDPTKCQIKALKYVRLGSCYNYMLPVKQVTHVPCGLLELHPQLTILDVSMNRIESFCRGLDTTVQMSCLTELDLTLNKLTMLEPSVFCGSVFPNLKVLSLVSNKLSYLPEEFCTISSLQKLYLSQNELTHLPESIGDLQQLFHLELSSNLLRRLPDSFAKITTLHVLDLTSNRLEYISDDMFESWSKMQDLFLANNRLSNDTFNLSLLGRHMIRLYRLNLGFNRFTSLDAIFDHGRNIIVDDVGDNNMNGENTNDGENSNKDNTGDSNGVDEDDDGDKSGRDLGDETTIYQISQLIVTGNQLTELPTWLGKRPNLRGLHAGLNKLKSIPQCIFTELTQLKMLSLFGNELSDDSIPVGLLNADSSRFDTLTLLDLSHNNLSLSDMNPTQFYTELLNRQSSNLDIQIEFNNGVQFVDGAVMNDPSGNSGSISSGMAHIIGMRPTMEDNYILKNNLDVGSSEIHVQLYAIFDGHAGDKTVNYVAAKFPDVLCNTINAFMPELLASRTGSPEAMTEVEHLIMRTALDRMDVDVRTTEFDDGCTAIVCMILDHTRCVCANIGDSRIILVESASSSADAVVQQQQQQQDGRDGHNNDDGTIGMGGSSGSDAGRAVVGVKRITVDHKPRALFEKRRIREAGSCVHDSRVNGYGVSRSIGDHAQRPAICSDAYITSFTIDPSHHQFIVLACDGVWDVLQDHEAAQFVADTWNRLPERLRDKDDCTKLSYVSAALRDFALALRSMDNISTMILKPNHFHHSGKKSS